MSENELFDYETFKMKHIQKPISFLTEKNLEELEEHCKKTIHFERGIEHKVTLELLDRYRELESEKEKLIKKLEEDIEITKKQYSENTLLNIRIDGKLDTLEEILQILKGVNDE